MTSRRRCVRLRCLEAGEATAGRSPNLRRALPIADPGALQSRLLQCHDSQVSGGKRYDRAIVARQQANATLASGETVDDCEACVLAMDLKPLVDDPAMTVQDWLARCLERFTAELLGC